MERWSAVLGFSGAALTILSFVSCGEGGAVNAKGTQFGGLYSIGVDDEYKVAKVLAAESNAIYLRVYDGSYDQRPSAADPSDLAVEDPALDVAERGLPAFAMEPGVFVTMQPSLLSVEAISSEEPASRDDWNSIMGGWVLSKADVELVQT